MTGIKIRKKGEVSTDKLISTIIIVIAVIIVIIALAIAASRSGVIDNLLTKFPDFFKLNNSSTPPEECLPGYTLIGYLDQNQNIILNYKRTNLFIAKGSSEKSIKVHNTGSYIFGEREVGYVDSNGVLKTEFYKADQEDASFRDKLPEVKERRLLYGSQIYQGALCLANDVVDNFIEGDNCILTCKIAEGVCSLSPITGKVEYKKLDCPDNQLCYVNLTEDKISNDNISISRVLYKRFIKPDGRTNNETNNAQFISNLNAMSFEKINLYIEYRSNISMCYFFDSDKDTSLLNGYKQAPIVPSDKNLALIYGAEYSSKDIFGFSYSGEKFINFIAWNNKNKQKIIKRWKFNNEGNPSSYGIKGYPDGKTISDADFGWEIRNANVGDIFYVFNLPRTWSNGWVSVDKFETSDYQIKIEKSYFGYTTACINAKDNLHGAQGLPYNWHALYCNKGSYVNTQPAYCMSVSGVSNTLTDTFDKNCEWAYS